MQLESQECGRLGRVHQPQDPHLCEPELVAKGQGRIQWARPTCQLGSREGRLPTDSLLGRGGRERHCSLPGTCHRLGGPPWSLGTGLQGQRCRVAACAQGPAMHGWAAGCVCTLGSWPEWGVYRVFTGREQVLTPADGVLCKHTCCSRRVTGGQACEPQGTARGPPFPWPVC